MCWQIDFNNMCCEQVPTMLVEESSSVVRDTGQGISTATFTNPIIKTRTEYFY